MRKKIPVISSVLMLVVFFCSCAAKLTTIRPTLIGRIKIENITTGEKAQLNRNSNEETSWLMDDLIFQMERPYELKGLCGEDDGHLYDAKYYMGDKLELSVIINSDSSVCKSGRRYVQKAEDSVVDRSVNLDQWKKCFNAVPAPTSIPKVVAAVNLENVDLSAVLSGYPLNDLPPYECSRIIRCSFDTKEQVGYAVGRDTYTLTYETSADKETIFSFYNGILTTKDEQYNANWLNGRIGDNLVSIGISIKEGKPNEVSLAYALEDDGEPDPNPYFEKYPNKVIALGDSKKLYSTVYELYNGGNILERYILTYESTLSFDEFSLQYEKAYENDTGFVMKEDEFLKGCSFTRDNYSYDIILTESGSADAAGFLTIICSLQNQ